MNRRQFFQRLIGAAVATQLPRLMPAPVTDYSTFQIPTRYLYARIPITADEFCPPNSILTMSKGMESAYRKALEGEMSGLIRDIQRSDVPFWRSTR